MLERGPKNKDLLMSQVFRMYIAASDIYHSLEDDMSSVGPDLTPADWTPFSPFNLSSNWTPSSWTETSGSFSGVYLGAFTAPSPVIYET